MCPKIVTAACRDRRTAAPCRRTVSNTVQPLAVQVQSVHRTSSAQYPGDARDRLLLQVAAGAEEQCNRCTGTKFAVSSAQSPRPPYIVPMLPGL